MIPPADPKGNGTEQEESAASPQKEAVTDATVKTQNARQLNSAYRLIEALIGKQWWEAWTMYDLCFMLRAALSHPRCPTCKGTGYQGIIGHPGCYGGCEDCDGTGLALVGSREARSVGCGRTNI